MTKRIRTSTKRNKRVVVELPSDLWFLIGSYIAWDDIQSLYRFIGVSRNAIHFIQGSIKVLMNKLLKPVDEEEHALKSSLSRRYHTHVHYIDECIAYYANIAPDDTTVTLDEWREWDITLLFALCTTQLYDTYCLKRTVDSRRYDTIKYVPRICDPSPSSTLSNVFYILGETVSETKILPLHTRSNVHIVEGMSTTNAEDARLAIMRNHTECEQEVYLSMLHHAKLNAKYAAYYYAMRSELTVRKATAKDLFKDVVLERPGPLYLHIYSPYSPMVETFFEKCVIYHGKQKDAVFALYLDTHEVRHQNICLARCRQLLNRHKEQH